MTETYLFDTIVAYLESPEDAETPSENYEIGLVEDVYQVHTAASVIDSEFNGACFDTGAQKSVVGKIQAEAYFKRLGLPLMINKFNLFVDTVRNELVCTNPLWKAPMTRKLGHVYYDWDYSMLYSEQQLRRIHRHFYHPQPDRIFNLIKRASEAKANPETLKLLDKISRECDVCQRVSDHPGRFRVSLPNEDIVFNHEVLMDIMYLNSKPVLHFICRDTLFSAAAFLSDGLKTKDAFKFESDEWKSLLRTAGIEHVESGEQSHNSLRIGERYHSFLKRIYNRVCMAHQDLSERESLSIAVHAMNNTAGPNGLTPTLLAFGVIPPFPFGHSDIQEQRDRMKAMKVARDEMRKTISSSR
eukprot:IDg2098t1